MLTIFREIFILFVGLSLIHVTCYHLFYIFVFLRYVVVILINSVDVEIFRFVIQRITPKRILGTPATPRSVLFQFRLISSIFYKMSGNRSKCISNINSASSSLTSNNFQSCNNSSFIKNITDKKSSIMLPPCKTSYIVQGKTSTHTAAHGTFRMLSRSPHIAILSQIYITLGRTFEKNLLKPFAKMISMSTMPTCLTPRKPVGKFA